MNRSPPIVYRPHMDSWNAVGNIERLMRTARLIRMLPGMKIL